MPLFDIIKNKINESKQAETTTFTEPTPKVIDNSNSSSSFRMTVEDVFSIVGRGIVVVGTISSGSISVGENVHHQSSSTSYPVNGIEAFRKQLTSATAGDSIGLLIGNASRENFNAGDILVK